jgi:hypothetical protein
MSNLNENIRNIIFYYIKQKYNNYLKENNKTYVEQQELEDLIDKLYVQEKNVLQEYIRGCLRDMMANSYNSPLIENIIFEIFSDEQLAKNRVVMEINSFQENKKNKNNVYEALLDIHDKYGIGLKLNFEDADIVVSNLKKNPDDNSSLSAEKMNVSIGDSIIKINDIDFVNKTTQEIIQIFKDATCNKQQIKLTLKTYRHNNI